MKDGWWMVWGGCKGSKNGKREPAGESEVECDDVAWRKWNVFGRLAAILTWGFACFATVSAGELRCNKLKWAAISFLPIYSVPIICDYLPISLGISPRRFCILRSLIVSLFIEKNDHYPNSNDVRRLFCIFQPIHYSLMVPMFQLILTELLTDPVSEV